jgi:2-dehydro-3-deoxygalactonokinase
MGHQGLACIPGTHSKWAMLEDGAVTSMRSAMTGELFDILSKQSILRHGMPLQGRVSADDAAFLNAVDEMLADPAAALTSLFPLRAAGLLGFVAPEATQARLSGLLIGAEIGKMLAGHECGPITLIGQEGLGALYRAALLRAGVSLRYADAEEASRQGLLAAARKIWSF